MMRRALAVLILLVLAGDLLFIAGRDRVAPYRITAEFEKTIGLFENSAVMVLGVPVGEVTDVTPHGASVRVEMLIDGRTVLPQRARATIVPISLISDRYVQIFPPYKSGPTLQPDDHIPLDRTSIPAELDDLLANLQKLLAAIEAGTPEDPGALGDAVIALSRTLQGTGEDLSETLTGLGGLSAAVTAEPEETEALIVSLANLASTLSERRDEIARLNQTLANGLGAIAQERAALEGAIANIAKLTEQLGSIVESHRTRLETDLQILSRATAAVVRQQESVMRASDWLHVVADGGESSHNGGAVHLVGGVWHIDVRENHYGACPFPGEVLLCGLLAGASSPSSSSDTSAVPPTPAPAPAPSPTIDGLLDELLKPPVEGQPLATAEHGIYTERPSLSDRVASIFIRVGGWIHDLFGERP